MLSNSLRESARRGLLPSLAAVAIVALLVAVGARVQKASAEGASPAQLAAAGWTCFLPEPPADPDFNRNVHCAPPGQWEAVLDGTARSVLFLAFATEDVGAAEAELLGTERMIRSDLYNGQPCPTDPSPDDPPTYTYSDIEPLFGLDYHICHTFDSPW